MSRVEQWIGLHEQLFWWVGLLSLVLFVGTLGVLGLIVVKLPQDHFVSGRKRPIIPIQHRAGRVGYRLFKNGVGIFFILAGLIMLVLPGQGLVALLVGMSLTDFPGRDRLVRAIMRQKRVLGSANWLRAKCNRPPLKSP
jgi:hypothetical protein